MENFFSIPGLGSFTIDAINAQDFAVVRSMVYLGSVLYIVGLLLTDPIGITEAIRSSIPGSDWDNRKNWKGQKS